MLKNTLTEEMKMKEIEIKRLQDALAEDSLLVQQQKTLLVQQASENNLSKEKLVRYEQNMHVQVNTLASIWQS